LFFFTKNKQTGATEMFTKISLSNITLAFAHHTDHSAWSDCSLQRDLLRDPGRNV